MDIELTHEEVRVLGALLEKKMATPEYYPLSLNGLVNACNQKVNRSPVVAYEESTVLGALEGLRTKQLVWVNHSGRVIKYKEAMVESQEFSRDQAAVMCILLLRGPQTVGEIRARTDRMHGFEELAEVHQTLDSLGDLELVEQCARQPGQKEARFCQLLGPRVEEASESGWSMPEPLETVDPDRIAELEEKVTAMAEELNSLNHAADTVR